MNRIYGFFSPQCHFCIQFKPVYNEIKKRFNSIIKFEDIIMDGSNQDKNDLLMKKYNVNGYPTLIFVFTDAKGFKEIEITSYKIEDYEIKINDLIKKNKNLEDQIIYLANNQPSTTNNKYDENINYKELYLKYKQKNIN